MISSTSTIYWPGDYMTATTTTARGYGTGSYQSSLNSIDFRKVLVSKWESHPEVILEEEPYDYGPNSF